MLLICACLFQRKQKSRSHFQRKRGKRRKASLRSDQISNIFQHWFQFGPVECNDMGFGRFPQPFPSKTQPSNRRM